MSLISSDNNRMVVAPLGSTSTSKAIARIEFSAASPTFVPTELKFKVESSLTAGAAQQSIELFNYDTQQFQTMDTRPASPVDTAVEVDIVSNVSRFIDPVTKAIRARFTFTQAAVSAKWKMQVDQGLWTIIY